MDEKYMISGPSIRAIIYWGLWPSNVKKYPILNKLHKVYSLLNLLIFFTFFFSMCIQLFYVWKDILELMFNLSIFLLYNIILAKISLLLFNRKRISDLFERSRLFQEKIMNGRNEKNKKIFLKFVYVTNQIVKPFWAMVFCTCALLEAPGFLALFGINNKVEEDGSITKALPFSCWLPFDQQKYHASAVFTQMIISVPGTAYVAVWDTIIFSLMMNIICQIKVLQNSLISIEEHGTISVYQSAVECVQYHQEIIKFVADLDALIMNVMFLDFVVYAIFLCSIGIRVLFDPDIGIPMLVSCTTYFAAAIVQLYMFYWTGNLVMAESVEIATAAWKSQWYQHEKPVAKLLIMVMMRARKPLKLSVGRFYNMNLESFVVILRAWYSYLTLLNQMRDE